MIRVRGFQSLPVGLVPQHDGRPHLGIVLKTTFTIPPPGQSRALGPALPAPIRGDEPHSWHGVGAGELAYASDLAPRKSRADVLLTGHAAADMPTMALPIRISIGSLRRQLVAVTSAPALRVPLAAEHLRTATNEGAGVAPLRPGGARLRRPRRAGRSEAAWGPFMIDVPSAEEGLGYQAAPPEQWLPLPFEQGAEIYLGGLADSSGASSERWFWLPRRVPFAVVIVEGRATAVPMVCDTVHIDADAGVISLVHRGLWSAPVSDLTLLVGLLEEGAPRDAEEAHARIAEATPLGSSILGAGGEPVAVAPVMGRDEPPMRDFDDLPAQTAAFSVAAIRASLPFERPTAPTPPPSSRDAVVEATGMMDLARLGPALPFSDGFADEPPASRREQTASIPSAALLGFDDSPGETRPIEVAVPAPPPPLPSSPWSAGPAPVPTPVPAPVLTPAPAPFSAAFATPFAPAPLPAPLPAPAPSAPRIEDEAPIGRPPLTLEELADVQVELAASKGAVRRTILARHRLDPVSWAQESARWSARLEAEAARGESRTLDALLARARTRREETGDLS